MNSAILVRRMPFAFSDPIAPVWNPARPEWSHMVNGASLAMPYLEPFLIKTVMEALSQVENVQLKADVHAFVGQEGQHFQNHRRYNELLKRHYPELVQVEEELDANYGRYQSKSLRWRLAYTAGFETMTIGITEWLIGKRAVLFTGADPSVTSLVLWHMVEETEHKNVAFDLYQDRFGAFWPRVWGVCYATAHVAWASRKAYKLMLKRDGRWSSLSSRLRLYHMIARFLLHTSPAMLRSLSPFYHPAKVIDPAWVSRWAEAYSALPKGAIPLLDTSNPEIPAQFTTS